MNQILASDYNYLIVGGGNTGLSAARFLNKNGKQYRVYDTRENESLLDGFKEINPESEVFTGRLPENLLDETQEIILSPGVSRDEKVVIEALEKGIPVKSDIALFLQNAEAPVVGITGTNGKSTVTTMVGLAAECAQISVGVGGNLGVPALDLLAPEIELYVLELSSFQLESTDLAALDVAANLNVSADHLDRHKDLLSYFNAKQKIFHGAKRVVYKLDDRLTHPPVVDGVKRFGFGLNKSKEVSEIQYTFDPSARELQRDGQAVLSSEKIQISGLHNIENALATYAICDAAGIPFDSVAAMLESFSGLKHRCQFVRKIDSVTFINDSKSTNVGSVLAALNGLKGAYSSIIWIAGGVAKGADFSSLKSVVSKAVASAVLIGQDANLISDAISDACDVVLADSLESALARASELAGADSLVLFSPGCASFDMFRNFEHRGDAFIQAVEGLRQ